MASLALYPRLLGDAWGRLPEPVRRCHDAAPRLVAKGSFTVTRASSFLSRIALALAAMPPAGEGIALILEVIAFADHQIWRRDFAGFVMVTRQTIDKGLMIERRGTMELAFTVTAEERAIVYRPAGIRLRIGPLSIPIPRWLGPRVEGRAWNEPGESCMRVSIVIGAPLLGRLVTYGGPLEPADPRDVAAP